MAELLSIKLTSRIWDGQRVWMCGFPLAHLDKHLRTMVQQYKRSVALCEEFRKPQEPDEASYSKPSFERRVSRIITPGTLIDESFLNPLENSFLLAIRIPQVSSGSPEIGSLTLELAWIDVSTGEFYSRNARFDELEDHLVRISPQEIVLDSYLQAQPSHPVHTKLRETSCPVSYVQRAPSLERSVSVTHDAEELKPHDEPTGIDSNSATALLRQFLKTNMLDYSPKELGSNVGGNTEGVQIDAHTLKALEIKAPNQEGFKSGSLMHAMRRNVTSAGTRLLSRWLCESIMV